MKRIGHWPCSPAVMIARSGRRRTNSLISHSGKTITRGTQSATSPASAGASRRPS